MEQPLTKVLSEELLEAPLHQFLQPEINMQKLAHQVITAFLPTDTIKTSHMLAVDLKKKVKPTKEESTNEYFIMREIEDKGQQI